MHAAARLIQREGILLPDYVRRRLGRYFSAFSQEGEAPAGQGTDRMLEEAVLLLISALARRKKLLIILEDVQWCDRETLALGDAVLRRAEHGAVMAVLTRRTGCPPQVDEGLARCVADGLLREQHLYPLTGAETEEFLRRELGEETARRLAPQFYRESGGDLHLLTELTQAYRRQGSVDQVIATTQDILLARLAGLGEAAERAAQLISLFPRRAPCAVLLVLADRDDRLLTRGIEELSGRGLIAEENREGVPSYAFTHRRIQELVYSRQSFFQRRELHLRVARLMADGTEQGTAELFRAVAWHYRRGDAALPALDYELRALDLETARHYEPFPILALREGEESRELTPDQLRMVEEIVERYLPAWRRPGAIWPPWAGRGRTGRSWTGWTGG